MSSALRPLRVVLISQDKSLLHEISWVLEAVGYEVRTSGDFDPNALWRRYSLADFIIADARGIAEPVADIFSIHSDNPIYRFFLYDPAKQTDFAAWYAAGGQDALRTPLSRGELLARLRTGARYLEFERRMRLRSSHSPVPGTHSRRGLLRKLRHLAENEPPGLSQHTVLATSIDWYEGITRQCGESTGCSLVSAVAEAIRRAAGEDAVTAYFGDGRVVTLLAGQPLSAAKGIADSLATDFGSRESRSASNLRPTLTSAVIAWAADTKPDALASDALETLQLAEYSGGNCVVVHGEFNKEYAAWKEEMSAGNPFANVVAQDIMEPFPAVLEQGAEQSELAAALQRAGVAVRPYVDREGRMVGVASDGGQLAMPETIAHNASFPEIYEAFSSRACSTLVVTAESRPLGYITCDGFLSMIDPIDTETYAGTDKSADELAYLVVPSVIGAPAAVDGVGQVS